MSIEKAGKMTFDQLDTLYDVIKKIDFPSIVLLGDSITQTNGFTNQTSGNNYFQTLGYFNWFNLFSGNHFEIINNAGIGGNTTAQMLARLQMDVLAYASDWVMVYGGINDIGGSMTALETIANLTSIYNQILAKGKHLLIATVFPSSTVNLDEELTKLGQINSFIVNFAKNNRKVVLCDWFHAMADITGKTIRPEFTADGTHPNALGARQLGKKLFNVMKNVMQFTPNNLLEKSNKQGNNAIPNNVFEGTATQATGWNYFGSTGITYSKETYLDDTDLIHEQCMASPDARNWQMGVSAVNVTPGDVVEFLVRVRFENLTGLTHTNIRATFGTQSIVAFLGDNTLTPDMMPNDIIFRTPRITVPVGVTTASITIYFANGIGKVRISNPTLRKIT